MNDENEAFIQSGGVKRTHPSKRCHQFVHHEMYPGLIIW
jgi:hypothetical protein